MSGRESFACARITAAYLLGGLAIGLGLALPVSEIPEPGHPHLVRNVLSGLILFAAFIVASVGWGRAMARRTGCPDAHRMGRMAGWSFAPAAIGAGVFLGLLESYFVGLAATRGVGVHVVYTLLFVPATWLVASVTALTMGAAVGGLRAAARLSLATGGAAAVAFLAANVFMDLIGWRVGAPGAAERATMLVVTMIGVLAASLAGGAVLGRGLRRGCSGTASPLAP